MYNWRSMSLWVCHWQAPVLLKVATAPKALMRDAEVDQLCFFFYFFK
jgi:hypothetical protein